MCCWPPSSPAGSSCWPWPPGTCAANSRSRRSNGRRSSRLAVLLPAVILALFVGSELGVVEATYQPMKIAAAEAQWNTCDSHCSFSAFQIGGGNNDHTPTQIIEIPSLLSILATNSPNGKVEGLTQLNAQYQKEYGPGNYVPNVFIQYWSMRVMAYLATLVFVFALWGGWLLYRRKTGTREVVPANSALGGDPALPHQHRRLDAGRERAPALDRPGTDEDGQRGLALRVGHRHLDLPHRLRRRSSPCSASPTPGS